MQSHLIFDKEKILISPDLVDVFDFLMEIEKEVKVVVELEKRLENIKNHSLEFFDLIIHLAKKLEENHIDFEYKIQDPETFPKNFDIDFPVRAQMIVIFSFLETIFNIHLAYTHKTSNENEIRKLAMDSDSKKKFIDSYLLSIHNTYFKENTRLRKINSKSLVYLRNSLSHFFSIAGGIQINHSSFELETRKLEELFKKQGNHQIVFLSPEETYLLVSSGIILVFQKWSEYFGSDSVEFNARIKFVKEIVKNCGAKTILRNQLNI